MKVLVTVSDPSVEPRVRFDTEYLSTYTIEGVQPEPDQVIPRGDSTEFVFSPSRDASVITLSFALRADRFGPRSGRIESAGAAVWISQFIYP